MNKNRIIGIFAKIELKMKSRIISHGGITIDMETIKCLKLSSGTKKDNILVVEHKKRIEFVKNPKTNDYEKVEFNDVSEIEFLNYNMADTYKSEWEDIWNEYLSDE